MNPYKVKGFASSLLHHSSRFALMFQAVLILLALLLAWSVRFEFTLPNRTLLLSVAPVLVAIRLITIRSFGLHHGWWKYTGVSDAVNVIKAVGVGTVSFWLFMRFALSATAWPQSIYVLETVLTACFLGGARLASRALADSMWANLNSGRRVLVIGAGFGAQL